jgi:hypothetical protein
VHHGIRESPEIADAKPSKGFIDLFEGFCLILCKDLAQTLILGKQSTPLEVFKRRKGSTMIKFHQKKWQILLITPLIIFGIVMIGTLVSTHAGTKGTTKVLGKTYGEWSALWWQWAFSIADIPEGTHPINVAEGPADCNLGQQGPVWYLAGTGNKIPVDFDGNLGIQSAERSCSIPRAKALFFPIVNLSFVNEDEGATIEEKRALLEDFVSQSGGCQLEVYLDGEPIFTNDKVRTQSPPFFIEAIEGNVFDIAVGTVDPEVISDGFWVMLPPLSPGEHELRFKGSFCTPEEQSSGDVPFILTPFFTTDTTYHLTIEN